MPSVITGSRVKPPLRPAGDKQSVMKSGTRLPSLLVSCSALSHTSDHTS